MFIGYLDGITSPILRLALTSRPVNMISNAREDPMGPGQQVAQLNSAVAVSLLLILGGPEVGATRGHPNASQPVPAQPTTDGGSAAITGWCSRRGIKMTSSSELHRTQRVGGPSFSTRGTTADL